MSIPPSPSGRDLFRRTLPPPISLEISIKLVWDPISDPFCWGCTEISWNYTFPLIWFLSSGIGKNMNEWLMWKAFTTVFHGHVMLFMCVCIFFSANITSVCSLLSTHQLTYLPNHNQLAHVLSLKTLWICFFMPSIAKFISGIKHSSSRDLASSSSFFLLLPIWSWEMAMFLMLPFCIRLLLKK